MIRSSVDFPQPDGTDQRDELAGLDVEVDLLQREHVAALESLREALDRDGRGVGHATFSGARRTSSFSATATITKKRIPSAAAMMFVAHRLGGEVT